MLRSLGRLRDRSARGRFLEWPMLAASDSQGLCEVVDGLLSRRVDGVTIQRVFTEAECARASDRLARMDATDWTFGAVLGLSLGMVGPLDGDRSAYFEDTARCRELYAEMFGFDPHDRVAQVVSSMMGELTARVPEDAGRAYNPGQVRVMSPGRGGLPAHNGNEFHRGRDDTAVDHLATITDVEDHLSYFVVLQAPSAGGALSVYDLTSEQDDGTAHGSFGRAERDDSFLEGVAHRQFPAEVGSLFLFGGGWRWHRVDPVEGESDRITYGGFCAPSTDGRHLHFWS